MPRRTTKGSVALNNAKATTSSVNEEERPEVQETAVEVRAVRKLFTEAQRTVQCHQRCCDALRRLLAKHELAWEEYFSCVSRILLISKRDPGVERLVQFVSLAVASSVNRGDGGELRASADDASATLLDRTVEWLLGLSRAADKGVRFRCCQLLGGMTTAFIERHEDDFDRVVDILLPRLKDKVVAVRVQAVSALRPLQFGLEGDDDDEALKEDRVRGELIRGMMSDSSPDVRQAALAAVTKTAGIFDQLVLRTQDVTESVRRAAFRTLGDDVSPKHLHPQQRVTLIKRGLSDSSGVVVDACRFMLCAHWFRDVEYDPVELLKRVEVLHFERVPEQVVEEVVRLGLRADRERGDPSLGMGFTLPDAKALRNAAGKRIDLTGDARVSPEEALYARVQAEVVQQDKEMTPAEKETRLEAILPDTTSLCTQIERQAQTLTALLDEADKEPAAEESGLDARIEGEVFVLQQLLKLATHADFSEEAGRRRLVNLLQALLVDVNVSHHLVKASMVALAAAHPSEPDFVRLVAELVSDVSDLIHVRPAGETSVHNASLNMSLNASFTSVLAGIGDTPNKSLASMRSAVRAGIPKNFVKDRARAIEGISAMTTDADRVGGKAPEALSSEDEFMDALSHQSDDDGDAVDNLRGVAAGSKRGGVRGDVEEEEEERATSADEGSQDMRRMFRVLDMLSVLLTKTKQTLARDATLTAFEDVIMDTFRWSAEVLPTLPDDLQMFGPELRKQAVEVLGKYSLLGDTAAIRHRPMFFQIAMCEHEILDVRMCAMQALSDLSLVFRSAIVGSTGDMLSMYGSVLKDRQSDAPMVAVAAEAVARLFFFDLAHDPELLARLFVLFFEKGSAADSAAAAAAAAVRREGGEGSGDDEAEEGAEAGAKTVGGSVRLSQILGVYFRSLPAASPRGRDMLFESVRHVLEVLREMAELNVKAEENNKDDDNTPIAVVDVPVQDVIKFVRDLLMHEVAPSTSAAGEAEAEASAAAATSVSSEAAVDSLAEGNSEETDDNDQLTDQSEPADKSITDKSTMAAGHVALCVTEELFTSSGIDGLSDLLSSLAKVLSSLPLPEDDQAMVKRLRNSVGRLEALSDGRKLNPKVARVIDKYAKVLLAADLTPREGIWADEDEEESTSSGSESSGDKEGSDGAPNGEESTAMPQVAPSGRPARRSKVAAKALMSSAANAEAVADAAESDSESSSESEEDESDEGRSEEGAEEKPSAIDTTVVESDAAEQDGQEEDGKDDEEEHDCDDEDGYGSNGTVKSSKVRRSARANLRRSPRAGVRRSPRASKRAAPTTEGGDEEEENSDSNGLSDFEGYENTRAIKKEASPVMAKRVRRSGRAKLGAAPPTPLSDIGNSPKRSRRLRGRG